MIIQNRNQTYVAVQKLDSAETEQYLCRRMENGRSIGCRIAVLDKKWAQDLVAYLESQSQDNRFQDLEEYFTDDKSLYIVTAVKERLSLEEKLTGQSCSLSERLSIGQNLLECLLLQGYDDFLCCAVLSVGQIGVSDGLEISFQYDLEGITDHGQYRFVHTQAKLAEVFGFLFQEEMQQESLPELKEFIGLLRQGKFSSLMEVYSHFLPVSSRWMGRDERELVPANFWFRMWERIKGLGRGLLWLGKAALLMVVALYLALSVVNFVRPTEQARIFSEIGILTIQ